MNSRRVWTQQQDKAIVVLVQRYGHKNWAHIAIQLTRMYGAPQRTGKQCRERWHNHLNPGIQKKGWSKAEEQLMFQLHKMHGNKWTVIAQSLPGRTDNSIKNYFYSTIRRSLRRMGKFVGSKNSTEQMKHIKPSTLSKIFAATSQLPLDDRMPVEEQRLVSYIRDNCETVRDQIIKFTNYKPKRNDKAENTDKAQFEHVIEKMVHINNIYERIKVDEKRRRNQEIMFQRDNGKLVLSDDSFEEEQSMSEEKESVLQENQTRKNRNTPKRGSRRERQTKEMKMSINSVKQTPDLPKHDPSTDQKQVEPSPSLMVPTVILKSQPNFSPQDHTPHFQNNSQVQVPDFFVQLKDDYIPLVTHYATNSRYSFNLRSPGYFVSTPASNPFCFFQSPSSTPQTLEHNFTALQAFGGLHNSTIDEFQISIQRQIEGNMNRDGKTSMLSFSTIGSPGSAFSLCNFP